MIEAEFERDVETGLFVGYVPGFASAHTQAETLEDLRSNISKVTAMLRDYGESQLTVDFAGSCQ